MSRYSVDMRKESLGFGNDCFEVVALEPANILRSMVYFKNHSGLPYSDEKRGDDCCVFEYGDEDRAGMVALSARRDGSLLLVGEDTPELAREVAKHFMDITGLKETPMSVGDMQRCLRGTGLTRSYLKIWLELFGGEGSEESSGKD